MNKSKKLVFFGTEDFSAVSLASLIEQGFSLAAVVTKPDFKTGRGQHMRSPAVKTLAVNAGIPVIQPNTPQKIEPMLKSLSLGNLEHAVLVSYGQILPPAVLDLFPEGIVNVHPSLLPKYRGPSPIEAAILNGDEQTGVTLMKLSDKMDAGPVYAQISHTINYKNSKHEISHQLAEAGARLLTEKLPDILYAKLQPKMQDEGKASYCPLLNKADGIMDTASKTADRLAREVLAYQGFPKSHLTLFSKDCIVLSAHAVTEPDPQSLTIRCAENSLLQIDELIAPSGRKISGSDFIKGYKK